VSLRAEEILRVKFALGVSVTLIGAEPYITFLAIFNVAIQPYIIDPTTTSSSVVAGSSQPTAIVVASIPVIAGSVTPAFTVGTTVTIDVGPTAEQSQILTISGTTIWVTINNSHGSNGAYPVTMAGGEQVVRDILARIATIEGQLSNFAPQSAGVEQVDEIKLYPATTTGSRRGSRDMFESLVQQREQARDDLGEAVGFPNLRTVKKSRGNSVAIY
jgi:hypothetical protein